MHERYLRLPSRHLGRHAHLWTFGWWGAPILVFPTASGLAHEWRLSGAVESLAPLLIAGRIKLYCPESNASRSFHAHGPLGERMERHAEYERFVLEELVPFIREDCETPDIPIGVTGVSLGALYAANAALKHPEVFPYALCLSGRYDAQCFFDGSFSEELYFNAPFCYVPNLAGAALDRARTSRLTLVVGLGPFEGSCVTETLKMSEILRSRGIQHVRDVWGHDSAHHWDWWRRQLWHHLAGRYG